MHRPQTGNPTPPAAAIPAPISIPKSYPNGNPNAAYNPPGLHNTDSCLPRHPVEVVHNYVCDGPAPGDIAFRWIHGSVCAATDSDPRIQIVTYNEDTYILRENPSIHWEAPFTYLLFGNAGALLIDTGATPEAEFYPLRTTVDALITRWAKIRGRKKVPLTVVLTSGEDLAQNQGLVQFAGRPDTTLAPTSLAGTKQFYKLSTAWPGGTGTIDLGGRVLDVIPTPGTHKDGITFYDSYNRFLYTGDLLYPGRIQIANDRDYIASLNRLQQWTASHPLKWLMGGHVEMMFIPGRAYPRFRNYRPYEHTLELDAAILPEALQYATAIAGQSKVVFRSEFILLNRVGPDEQVYRVSPDMPNINVPFWLP